MEQLLPTCCASCEVITCPRILSKWLSSKSHNYMLAEDVWQANNLNIIKSFSKNCHCHAFDQLFVQY